MRLRLVPGILASVVVLGACGTDSASEAVESAGAGATWEPVSSLLGNPPNFAQLGNGSAMSVVSREWGRGAKAGALVELYWPHYANDNLWDSFIGLKTRGTKLRWAHDLTLKDQRIVPDTGRVVSRFAGTGVALVIEDVMRPGNDAHVRHVVIENTGTAPLEDVDVAFYAYYTVGGFPGGDHLRFDAARGALVQRDDEAHAAVATLADRPPRIAHCGAVLWDLPWGRDARLAAEKDELERCDHADAGLTGVNGVMMHRLDAIAPGASRDITYAIGLGAKEADALAQASAAIARGDFAAHAKDDADHWASVLGRAPLPPRIPAEAAEVYRRAIITTMQHRVDNGAFIAASTLTSPVYKLVWPRDGSKTAVDMLEAGFVPEAKAFFELLETLLKSDGSFAINYHPDASGAFLDLGPAWNENDQPGMLPWGVGRVFEATNDLDWARLRFPAVRRAADHLLAITTTGLVLPSRDLWELETGGSWTYSSGSAVAGLESAARLARALDPKSDVADRYEARAAEIRQAMGDKLVTAGFFGRGLKDGLVDPRLEIANLALGRGGFRLFPDSDPRLAKLGDEVATRLMTPSGAVRRYEGDRYYGGQPWPVAAAWLSLHRLDRGDRRGAEALFQNMTDQARATPTLMLGEQFDEARKVWLSAVPLVWSEAAYVRTARALYGE